MLQDVLVNLDRLLRFVMRHQKLRQPMPKLRIPWLPLQRRLQRKRRSHRHRRRIRSLKQCQIRRHAHRILLQHFLNLENRRHRILLQRRR